MENQERKVIIIGAEGQDGYWLSKLLIEKKYTVYGLKRRHFRESGVKKQQSDDGCVIPLYADITDFQSILSCINEIKPDEIYNLAGLSDVSLSWRQPVLTAQVNALGVVRILEAVKMCAPKARVFQASSSEMFGSQVSAGILNESSPFMPRNPYGTAKLYAHAICVNYRESFGVHVASGILFNHESVRRDVNFVTRKITSGVAEIYTNKREILELGNIDAVRDWGHARDYVRAMWMMQQQETPTDYIIATGIGRTVRDFVIEAFAVVGIKILWRGKGMLEIGVDADSGRTLVKISPKLYRYPANDSILGTPEKIEQELGFKCEISFSQMISEMVEHDVRLCGKECI